MVDAYLFATFLKDLNDEIIRLGKDKSKIALYLDRATSHRSLFIRQFCLKEIGLTVIVGSTVNFTLLTNNLYYFKYHQATCYLSQVEYIFSIFGKTFARKTRIDKADTLECIIESLNDPTELTLLRLRKHVLLHY